MVKSGLASAFLLVAGLAHSQGFDQALENTKKYYQRYGEEFAIGHLWLKKMLYPDSVTDRDIPRADAFAKIFGDKFAVKDFKLKRTINTPAELSDYFKRQENPFANRFYHLPEKYLTSLTHGWDDIMLKALYCNQLGYDSMDYRILNSLYDGQGLYHDTHNLLGLIFLEKNHCGDQARISRDKSRVIASITRAQKNDDKFSDIYAERAAMLYWAGAGSMVARSWIKKISSAQRADFGWADIGRNTSDAHATGLAALALKYFLLGLPSQSFYRD